MSEEQVNEPGDVGSEGSDVPADNFKAEVGRKFDNLTSKVEEQAKRNEAMLQQLASMVAPQKSEPQSDDIEDLVYSDPKEYARRIKEEAKSEVLREVEASRQTEAQKTQVLSNLISTYPELSDSNSEMTKKATAIYESLSEADKKSPLAYEVVVARAASELGVVPASKRKAANADSFSLQGGSSGSSRRTSAKEIPDGTAQLAELMGLNLQDKKTAERLKKLSNLEGKDWLNYKRRG